MSVPDPYKTLQVDSEAEFEVIEAAYRRLARKYHPDVSPDPESQERMVRINQAWELLRDPVKRAAVDRARTRNAGSAARVAAADARAQATAGHPATPPGTTYNPDNRYRPDAAPQPAPARAAPGQADAPSPGGAGAPQRPQPQVVSTEWTSGRSNAGGGFDPTTMATTQGVGSAGPPPGNPSGSVLNFGRYLGWSLGEIARYDLEYIEWLDRTPIGRIYQVELDDLLRTHGRRVSAPPANDKSRGLFRRR